MIVWAMHDLHNPPEKDEMLNVTIYTTMGEDEYTRRAVALHTDCRDKFGYVDDPLTQVHTWYQ